MIWSTLHSASQVLALAGLFSVFIATLMLWKRVRTRMRNYYSRSARTASVFGGNRDSSHTRMIDRATRNWLVLLPIMTGLSLMGNMWLLYREFHPDPQAPTVEYSDVRFLQQLDSNGYSWWMEKADGPFRADFCHDFDVPSLNYQPGEVAWRFKFKDMGSCWSIKDGDVRFYRDTKTRWTIPTDVNTDLKTALKEIKHE